MNVPKRSCRDQGYGKLNNVKYTIERRCPIHQNNVSKNLQTFQYLFDYMFNLLTPSLISRDLPTMITLKEGTLWSFPIKYSLWANYAKKKNNKNFSIKRKRGVFYSLSLHPSEVEKITSISRIYIRDYMDIERVALEFFFFDPLL